MERKREENEGLRSLEIGFGDEFISKFRGRNFQYIVVELHEGKNCCGASPIIRRNGKTEIGIDGTTTIEDIHKKTGKRWNIDQIIQGVQNYFSEMGVPEGVIKILSENSQKPPMILTR